ncbi:hypothetical protein AMS68_004489 [Peltaster fructicola]|uniref:Uncharacterized protein n=1 Tax=Peltaster fructicola TaxID=286661 RepID=A0A6H0XW24_9PEZI|nr:hypothetical protein AMS68_004489 [Peltaster fructicola]
MSAEDSDLEGVPLIEDIDTSDNEVTNQSKKRKRDGADGRPPKAKKTKKPKDIEDDALDVDSNVNHAIAHMDPALMADHIAQRTRRFRPDLSPIEAHDIHISAKAILDTTSLNAERNTERLAEFLESCVSDKFKDKTQKLQNAPNAMGSPHTIVITAAGMRAADLTRALRKFQTKHSMVAKLFAKHIKLNEALESTKKTRMGIGVGTPQRLIDLLDNDRSP